MSPQKLFTQLAEGKDLPLGHRASGVLMGKELKSQEAAMAALDNVIEQSTHGRVDLTNTMLEASKADAKGMAGASFKTVAPPEFMAKKEGVNYDEEYKYDREKNEDIGRTPFSLKNSA